VNSIDNFARSWQRAAAFPEVFPHRSSFLLAETERPWLGGSEDDEPSKDREPLLRQRLPHPTGDDGDEGVAPDQLPGVQGSSQRYLATHIGHDFYGTSSVGRSFGTSYGTMGSRMSESVRHNVVQLHNERQRTLTIARTSSEEPLMIKQVEHEDGTKENVVIGQSTMPQTIFNSVNVLIGVGLLSLPLGMKYAGWIPGLLFLLYSAAITAYTARILAKCLDVDPNLVTYADLAYISFGPQARVVTSVLFCLELLGACVALVVLFADSLDALIPGLGLLNWKIICGIILIPLNFVPLRLLSITSILGILSCSASKFIQAPFSWRKNS
jgi:vesicular inhibitory amino acid transporter